MSIQFFFIETAIKLKERKRLKVFLGELFNHYSKQYASLTVVFCTDEYLLGINKQFLAHDYYTDIITFNLAVARQPIEGEIYISVDRVKDNAVTHEVSNNEELHRIIFHGVLHLCGLKDKAAKHKAEMTRAEDVCLSKYFH